MQAHTRHTCESRMRISISYSHPSYAIHLWTSLSTVGPAFLTPTNRSSNLIRTTNQILPEIQPVMSATHLMIRLCTSLIRKHSTHRRAHPQSLQNRRIIRAPGKPLERSEATWKNAVICVRNHGHPFLVRKLSNLHLGSLRAKSQKRGLTNTSLLVSETPHRSVIAPCTRWRIISDTWIRMPHIYNSLKDMLRMVREHYHSSIRTS